ncbi:MAG TPA: OmpA family protein [Anaeromyxobacteraceae bacterium]|nr:OmpA family protein [Anaeromyxobacteraceae bacterium]
MNAGARAGMALAALVLARTAPADDPTRRGFDADPARLAVGTGSGFTVETATAARKGTFGLGVVLDYDRNLLSLHLSGQTESLLSSRLSAHLLAAYSFGRVELGVDVPFALSQSSNMSLLQDQGVTGPLVAPIPSSALGDIRLVAKLPLLDRSWSPVAAAALLDLRAPTGNGTAFYGDGFAAVPSVVATREFGEVRLDVQAGYAVRGAGQYAQLVVHDGFVWGVGASMDLPPLANVARWRAILELTGGWPRGEDLSTDRYRAPLEGRAGLRAAVWRGLSVELGGGTGIGEAGYGHPSWRVFFGVRWEHARPDRDGDGVPDDEDRCPDLPGLAELHGCPDEDTDGDGVPNRIDLCPLEKGPPELDGCPDFDGDGIPDREDRCPKEPGPASNDGCPIGMEPVVEIETERLSLRDQINFDTGRDTLTRRSLEILDEVAALLRQHAELTRIRVEGHTDNVGSSSYNRELSQRRAAAVARYLSTRGIAPDRLVPVGFGLDRPVASNATAGGRAKNRRVEFTILGTGGGPGAKTVR